jgi:hypothetical protein
MSTQGGVLPHRRLSGRADAEGNGNGEKSDMAFHEQTSIATPLGSLVSNGWSRVCVARFWPQIIHFETSEQCQ